MMIVHHKLIKRKHDLRDSNQIHYYNLNKCVISGVLNYYNQHFSVGGL